MDDVCAAAAALADGLYTNFEPEELYLCSNNDPDDDDAAAMFPKDTFPPARRGLPALRHKPQTVPASVACWYNPMRWTVPQQQARRLRERRHRRAQGGAAETRAQRQR